MLADTGDRRQFESGAVRDMGHGKGRCDLLPLDCISTLDKISELDKIIMSRLNSFKETGDPFWLRKAINSFILEVFKDLYTAMLELAKHYEDGAIKYGVDNWRKGIPANIYIDSAIRHYFKFRRGDEDEPHARAFLWNIICCIWTCDNIPELNVYIKS